MDEEFEVFTVKGIVIVRDFMIFLAELGVLLLSMLFLLTAGASMADRVFNFDSRLAAETIFGFEAAANMANIDFDASFTMPPNPYSISVGDDSGSHFVIIYSSREKFVSSGDSGIKTTVKFQNPQKYYLIHTNGINIIPLDSETAAPTGGKMSESSSWRVSVKKSGSDVRVSANSVAER